jgi:PAS domain S-box-containing protein
MTAVAAATSPRSDGLQDALVRLMLDQAQDHALILLDANGAIVAWRMGAERLFGYTQQEMLGERVDRLFTPEDRARRVPHAELEIAGKVGKCEDDRWLVRKDGVRLWVAGILSRLTEADGALVGYCKLLRDRTDIKEQTENLRAQARTLDGEVQRHNVLIGTLAHELRNPLGVLSNAVGLIDLARPGDPGLDQATQLIGRQTKYLATLIDDLLENVRLKAGKVELHRTRLNLHENLADALESVGAQLQDRGQSVELVLPQTPIVLDADATRLKQVFVNLLSNASKFSERGGKIWVKAMTEGGEAVVRFEDRGRGIPAELLPGLFNLFSQAPSAAGEKREGLGLGLAIVKQYVELHGGSVQARSEGAGRGSEFIVRLPLAGTG